MAAPLFTAIGVLLYVLLSLACSVVYAAVGVTPAQVGFNYSNLLANAAVALTAILAVAILVGAAIALVRPAVARAGVGARIALVVVVVILELDLALGLPVLDEPPFPAVGVVLVTSAIGALAIALVRRPELRRVALDEATRPGLALSLVVVTVAIELAGGVNDGVNAFRDGRRPSNLFLGIPPPWRAETARVIWTAGSPPAGLALPPCLFHLGSSEGTAVFYDAGHSSDRTLHLRADNVSIIVTPDRPECPQ